jgi:hypothetical protein
MELYTIHKLYLAINDFTAENNQLKHIRDTISTTVLSVKGCFNVSCSDYKEHTNIRAD